ncbi:uncharacterized protein LOC143459939 [Clavelina lepadiformis]|uniref:uncharacterized protein LOC143459939 n=1 Tax=Clavelina lepadiformis TaxID=159417 RepID=UPI004042E050
MDPSKVLHYFGLCCESLGSILFIVSQIFPFWLIDERNSFGIYNQCSFLDNYYDCVFLGWGSLKSFASFVARYVFLTAGVFIVLAGIPQWISFCFKPNKRGKLYVAQGVMILIAGIVMMAAMVAYTVLAIDEVSDYTSRWLFGWAYGLCWASGPLLIFGGSLNVAAGYVKSPPEEKKSKSKPKQESKDYERREDELPEVTSAPTQYQMTSMGDARSGYYNPSVVTSNSRTIRAQYPQHVIHQSYGY